MSHPTSVDGPGRVARVNGRRSALRLLPCLLALLLAPFVARTAAAQDAAADGFLRLALPPTGEVRVENRRGGVSVEVWDEEAFGLAVVSAAKPAAKKTARAKSPVAVDRTEKLLSVVVARGATAATQSRVDLRLRVPASARLKLSTAEGEIEISGLPDSLSAQTVSGNVSVNFPQPLDANITAQSLNGSVTLGEGTDDSGAAPREVRGKFQTRWGAGSRAVNLFSGRGRIRLGLLPAGQEIATRPDTVRPPRIHEPLDPGAAAPVRRPTPQPAETPQEVDDDEVVRVESDLVTLNIGVVDRASGRGLAGLAQSDFKLAEDNVEQQIEHFETSEAPFDLLLLIDLSGSTAKVTDIIRAAAQRFVAATRPQDRVAVLAFSSETVVVSPLTDDRRALRERIARMSPPTGDTRLYDAVARAITYIERESPPTRRRAIILMTDGLDSTMPNVTGVGSQLPYSEVRDRTREFDGLFYSVWTSTEYEAFSPEDIQPETFDLAHDRTKELADAGGGAFYLVERLEDLAGAYERVVADLGTVYTLSYRPTNKQRDGAWRAIRVRLPRHPAAVARGKRGYYAK